jgi:hypothetical protein
MGLTSGSTVVGLDDLVMRDFSLAFGLISISTKTRNSKEWVGGSLCPLGYEKV